jgi:hypothetical protein
MAAVTADTISSVRALNNATEAVYPVKTAGVVYIGALACMTTIGRVQSATAAASLTFAGEVVEVLNDSGAAIVAGTGNAGGTVKAKIRWGHEMLLGVKTSTRTYSNIGKTVHVSTNVDVAGTSVGTAGVRVLAGTLTQFGDTTATGWVRLRTMGTAAATA